MKKPRLAVILFNLGGPDKPESVRPFLLNLFKDPAILRVPFFVRPFLARLIAHLRTKPATANYAILGGGSPLLGLTQDQARALETALPEFETRCFIAMRYWHPFSDPVAKDVRDWSPDEVVLLPLYPQYSTTTTGSSLTAWREAAAKAGLVAPVTSLCCYHADPDYVAATAAAVHRAYESARQSLPDGAPLRVLFSAHGLPQTIVTHGDPYQFQIERSTAAVVRSMAIEGLDWTICYQSRATPQKWLEPSIEQALLSAAADKTAVLVVPIAFVSEHSETLVELDVEYREFAEHNGVPGYFRAPCPEFRPGIHCRLGRIGAPCARSGTWLVQLGRGAHLSESASRLPARAGGCPGVRGCMSGLTRAPLRLVIFDCDGVLVDSEGPSNRLVAAEITALGWPMTGEESQALFVGRRLSDIPPIVEPKIGHPVPPGWIDDMRAKLISMLADEVEAMPGAHGALQVVTALGLPFRIASNSSHAEMAVKFERTGMDHLVAGLLHSARDVARGKPAPDVFLAAAKAAGVPSEACLVIEDSVPGAMAARAAGMACVGLAPYGDDPALRAVGAVLIRSFEELPAILRAAMAGPP